MAFVLLIVCLYCGRVPLFDGFSTQEPFTDDSMVKIQGNGGRGDDEITLQMAQVCKPAAMYVAVNRPVHIQVYG